MRALAVLAILVGCGRLGFDPTGDGGTDAPLPEGRWRRVALSGLAGCGVTTAGALWCWGQGFSGGLGIGTVPGTAPPTRVGTESDWTDVALHDEHTCGLRGAGELWCWGSNRQGALGTGVVDQRYETPQQVSPGALWKTIDLGGDYTCAIRSDDTLWCWGVNLSGQLGIGSNMDQARPAEVFLGAGRTVIAISAGTGTTCAITDVGALWCWGTNRLGQVGDGTTTDSNVPIAIQPARTWSAVTVGYEHTCALDTTGATLCWGRNFENQLGDPLQVPAFVRIVAGELHTCALTASGEPWCWGEATTGRIAGRDAFTGLPPSRLSAPSSTQLVVGGSTTCVIDDDAHLFCTGANGYGQTGLPAGEVHGLERADTRTDWRSIYMQGTHACGLLLDQTAMCWGRGQAGQLGDGDRVARQRPVPVAGTGFDHLEIGEASTVAFAGVATYGWGYDSVADLVITTPTAGSDKLAMGLGSGHTCFIEPSSVMYCVGDNTFGQLGIGTTTSTMVAVSLPGQHELVAAWRGVSCSAEAFSRQLQCWGAGVKTGTGSTGLVTTPTNAGTLAGVTRIELGDTGGCALVNAGELWCWGDNGRGEVGDGTMQQRLGPVRIGTRSDWRVVDLGDLHACAIAADGTLWCWGHDDQGQLGQATMLVDRNVPTQVGNATDWLDVACGDHFTCAIRTDGTRWCFGLNEGGQLGNGRSWLPDFTVVP